MNRHRMSPETSHAGDQASEQGQQGNHKIRAGSWIKPWKAPRDGPQPEPQNSGRDCCDQEPVDPLENDDHAGHQVCLWGLPIHTLSGGSKVTFRGIKRAMIAKKKQRSSLAIERNPGYR